MSMFNTVISAIRSLFAESDRDRQSAAEPSSRGTVSVEYDPSDEETNSTVGSDSDAGVDSHEEAVSTSSSGDDIIPEPKYDTEPSPDASTEATVKGTDINVESQASNDTDTSIDDPADSHPAATETDASASTGSLVEDATGKEPAEAVGTATSNTDTERMDDSDTNSNTETPTDAVGTETDASASTASLINEATGKEPAETVVSTGTTEQQDETPDTAVGRSVQEITGIGSAYEERLSDAGVDSVADLAASEPTVLAEATDIAETRIARWIDQTKTDGEAE